MKSEAPCDPQITGRIWSKRDDGRTVKVLGFVDGYVVVRRPRAMPYIVGWKEFQKEYVREYDDSSDDDQEQG